MELHSTIELHAWLKEWDYFEESDCLSTHPTADECSSENTACVHRPGAVTIELAQQCGGGSMAGDVRIMRVFRCTGLDVVEWNPSTNTGTYMDAGVAVIEQQGGLGMDLGRHGRLICGRLIVDLLPDRSVSVVPFIDRYCVTVCVLADKMPTSSDWIAWFKDAGENVVWRVYGGSELPVEQMSGDVYSGFLQRRKDVATTSGGIFIAKNLTHLLLRQSERSIAATEEPGRESLWRIAQEGPSRIPTANFTSGNCVFTGEQWKRYIREGAIPDFSVGTGKE